VIISIIILIIIIINNYNIIYKTYWTLWYFLFYSYERYQVFPKFSFTWRTLLCYIIATCIGKSRNLGSLCVSVQSLWKLSNRDTNRYRSHFVFVSHWILNSLEQRQNASCRFVSVLTFRMYFTLDRISWLGCPQDKTPQEKRIILNENFTNHHLSLFVLINIIYWSTVLTLSACWLTQRC